MALRRDFAKHLIRLPSARATAAPPPALPPSRSYVASPYTASRGFFQRILQRRTINQSSSISASSAVTLPEFMAFSVGDKLRDKLSEMTGIGGDRIYLDGRLARLPVDETVAGVSLTAEDARKIVRAAQVEKVKERLRAVPESAVSYSEFVQICAASCGSERRGLEFAKLLDDTANVIVWGDVVFLRPDQVAKSMESLITEAIPMGNDPRRKELEEMEKVKAQIDERAQTLVRRELYGGLGLWAAQMGLFMRLTFWELSWDVMEPICFFVTSLHFALAYAFFLRTSLEPSFEGYFRRRFRIKQAHLMKLHGFDLEKYELLSKAFCRPEESSLGFKSLCF